MGGFRHTSATLLINKGVHAKLISERLGHSNISTTMNIYGHALQSADRDAANKLDSLVPPKKEKRNG
uniref:tyrosine-type recombinase/integrase n=1 Tax=Paenibacillus guangzhouensis TaxID=1473112 RepID=UPI00389915B7